MKKRVLLLLSLILIVLLSGCGKAEPLIGIHSQPADEKPKRALYLCAPEEVETLSIDTYYLNDGQWCPTGHYEIEDDDSEMNQGVIHGILRLELLEDLSVSYEFSYAGFHLFKSEPVDFNLKNTEAKFIKETTYDIVADTAIPVMLITEGGSEEISVSDFNTPEKLSDCGMVQAVVLTFST